MITKNTPVEERLYSNYRLEGECWMWQGAVSGPKKGWQYGTLFKEKKRVKAHRLSYELKYGFFDQKLFVCHKCDNTLCINPEHLFLGNQTDNMRDCSAKGRVRNQGSKDFRCIDPDGKLIEANDLTKFCRVRGLNQGGFWSMLNGDKPQYRGYKRVQ